jgi:hypothetical protein
MSYCAPSVKTLTSLNRMWPDAHHGGVVLYVTLAMILSMNCQHVGDCWEFTLASSTPWPFEGATEFRLLSSPIAPACRPLFSKGSRVLLRQHSSKQSISN